MTGSLGVRYVGHATVLLDLDGVRVLTDPFLRARLGPLRRHGPVPDPRTLGPIDVVLISHGHPDHLDPRSLAAVPGGPLVLAPAGLGAAVRRALRRADRRAAGEGPEGPTGPEVGEVREVRLDEAVELGGGWTVRAVPARHWRWPRAPRARAVGYVLERDGSDGVYFAGDTSRYPAMRSFADRVDIALLPVGTWGPHLGPGHLSPRTAAAVARDLGARVAVPIHWGTLYPAGLDRIAGAGLTEPANRFRDWSARLAPALDVRILQPGEATTIERPAQPPGGATDDGLTTAGGAPGVDPRAIATHDRSAPSR